MLFDEIHESIIQILGKVKNWNILRKLYWRRYWSQKDRSRQIIVCIFPFSFSFRFFSLAVLVDPFFPFYTPWKQRETTGFKLFSGGCKMGTLTRNELIYSRWVCLSRPVPVLLLQIGLTRNFRDRLQILLLILTLSWRKSLSCRNQFINLHWFLYDLSHERVRQIEAN